jgi:hypothetical protein
VWVGGRDKKGRREGEGGRGGRRARARHFQVMAEAKKHELAARRLLSPQRGRPEGDEPVRRERS